jgi:hypothetical protein
MAGPPPQLSEVRTFPTLPDLAAGPALQPGSKALEDQTPTAERRGAHAPLQYILDIVRIALIAAMPFIVIFLLYRLGR